MLRKTFYCNDHSITEFGVIDSKNSSTAYVILYELIDTWFLDSNRRAWVWSLPWRWHILSISLTKDRGTYIYMYIYKDINIYIYMQVLYFYMSSVFFLFTNCVLVSDDNSLLPGCLWLLKFGLNNLLPFDTRYLVFYNPSPPRMFLSLDLLSEYRIQHGTNGPLYFTSSYSTWIFCRGVSGFATDCPCGVWCRGLTTCLLHVGPPFGNRILNNSWAVGLTYWIIYLHFFVFWHMQLYMSWYIISLFGFIFTS